MIRIKSYPKSRYFFPLIDDNYILWCSKGVIYHYDKAYHLPYHSWIKHASIKYGNLHIITILEQYQIKDIETMNIIYQTSLNDRGTMGLAIDEQIYLLYCDEIQVFNLNLNYIGKFKLNFLCTNLAVGNGILYLLVNTRIYFYNLNLRQIIGYHPIKNIWRMSAHQRQLILTYHKDEYIHIADIYQLISSIDVDLNLNINGLPRIIIYSFLIEELNLINN